MLDQNGHIVSDRLAVERVVLVMYDLVDSTPLNFRESCREPIDHLFDGFILRLHLFLMHILSVKWRHERVNSRTGFPAHPKLPRDPRESARIAASLREWCELGTPTAICRLARVGARIPRKRRHADAAGAETQIRGCRGQRRH